VHWLALLVACGEPRPPPERRSVLEPDAAWALARERLTDPKTCFRSRAAYCVRDPAVLDPFIQHELDRAFDGEMPSEPQQVSHIALAARALLLTHLRTDGRAHVEARIAERYAHPEPKIADGVARIWMGVPPGRFAPGRGMALHSPLVDRGEWATAEIAATFERFAGLTADRLILQVEVPVGGDFRMMEIGWDRAAGRIHVWDRADPTAGWTTALHADGWAAYADGRATLHTSELQRCPTRAYGAEPDCNAMGEERAP
jgi:hypothetical protein